MSINFVFLQKRKKDGKVLRETGKFAFKRLYRQDDIVKTSVKKQRVAKYLRKAYIVEKQ